MMPAPRTGHLGGQASRAVLLAGSPGTGTAISADAADQETYS